MSRRKDESPPQPRLIVISSPSGGGKTTLCKMLLENFSNIQLSISATTRPKRPNEVDGKHYYFFSDETFRKMMDREEFVEWAVVHGHYYGTLKSSVEKCLAAGRHLLLDIDVQGAKSFVKLYGDRTLLIFIHPPSIEALEKRLVARKGDSKSTIEKRLQGAYNELEWSKVFDHQIINEELKKAYQQLKEIIKKECR